MKTKHLACFTFLAAVCLATEAKAEKGPLSFGELETSDLIVVGTISRLRVESEPSRIERRYGNRDWGIYITLVVDKVEKGQFADAEIEFRCFRKKYRRSFIECISRSGHSPIPGKGTTIRAYLNGGPPNWSVAYPNGITTSDANESTNFRASRDLPNAPELAELRGRMFTYFLPLELWCVTFVVGVPLTILAAIVARGMTTRR